MLRILHLEDSPIDAKLVAANLKRGQVEAEILRVDTREAFTNALQQNAYDLVLADYSLPSFDGASALEIARKLTPELPFIFVSGALGEELAIETLKKGATDYVLKHGMERLVPSVQRALRESRERAELKQAEAARRVSDELAARRLVELQDLYSTAPVGLCFVDRDLRIVKVNARLAEIDGRSVAEHMGKTLREILGPFADRIEPLYRHVLDTGEPILDYELQGTTPASAEPRVFQVSYYPVKTDGRVAGVNSVVQDITERKRNEAELQATNERLRMALEAGHMGAWQWYVDSNKVVWSPTLEVLHGLKVGTFKGTFEAFKQGIHPEDRERVLQVINNAIAARSDLSIEYRILWPDRTEHWVESHGKLLLDENKRAVSMMGVCMDITYRKENERERQNLLAREKAARAEAEDASRAKDEFLATLSHELRTPLTPMLGWTRILRMPTIDAEKMKHGLEVIERNIKAQAQLIEDLLDVSRIITGKLQLNVRLMDLVKVIESALDVIHPSAEAKGLRIEAQLDREAAPFLGDPDRLQQVAWNLLTNAIKFSPRGGKITVSLKRARSTIEFKVSDSGEGISPEFLPQLFSRFTQADSSKTRVHGGLGLGLSIVRHLVELHGGHVEASSAGKDKGATFTIHLPIATSRDDLTKTGRYSMPMHDDESQPDLKGIKLLIVDDEPDARDLLKSALTAYGAEVESAASVVDALDVLQRSFPDLLISDLGMPIDDGFALIRKVKLLESQTGKRLPAMALTAYAGTEDQQRALAAGFIRHLAKPVDPLELARLVIDIVKK